MAHTKKISMHNTAVHVDCGRNFLFDFHIQTKNTIFLLFLFSVSLHILHSSRRLHSVHFLLFLFYSVLVIVVYRLHTVTKNRQTKRMNWIEIYIALEFEGIKKKFLTSLEFMELFVWFTYAFGMKWRCIGILANIQANVCVRKYMYIWSVELFRLRINSD